MGDNVPIIHPERVAVNLIEKYINRFLKAHAGGVGAALALLLADLQFNHGHLTLDQGYGVLAAYLGVGAVVAIAPNSKNLVADVVDETLDAVAPVQDDGTEDEPVV